MKYIIAVGIILIAAVLSTLIGQLEQYAFFKWIKSNQWYLVGFIILCLIVLFLLEKSKESIGSRNAFELIQAPLGEPIRKASFNGFEKELEEAVSEHSNRINNAKNYFKAGEHNRISFRFREAAVNYQKSINSFPTISAYLNLGNSFLMNADFEDAKQALTTGLSLAKEREKLEFEGALFNNLGIVYSFKKNMIDQALMSFEKALKIYEKTSDNLGKANILSNIGNVYLEKGKKKEAFDILGQALDIYENIDVETKELEFLKGIVKQLKIKTGQAAVFTQHNNVPGAVNRRRELIAEKHHYFTFTKELANLLVKQNDCTIILKVDCFKHRPDWQYLFYLRSQNNEIIIPNFATVSGRKAKT